MLLIYVLVFFFLEVKIAFCSLEKDEKTRENQLECQKRQDFYVKIRHRLLS